MNAAANVVQSPRRATVDLLPRPQLSAAAVAWLEEHAENEVMAQLLEQLVAAWELATDLVECEDLLEPVVDGIREILAERRARLSAA